MYKPPPSPKDITIPSRTWSLLASAEIASHFKTEMWQVVEEAVDEWVRRHNPDALAGPKHTGLQWKQLFLPEGTVVRTVFAGKSHHAVVDGDAILYQGKRISPSGFVNAVGGTRRNAWNCIYLLFPDTQEWKLAAAIRPSARKRRSARGLPARTATPPSSPALSTPVANDVAQENSPQSLAPQDAAPRAPRPPAHSSTSSGVSRPNRRTHPDAQIAALLRQELMPFLSRLCGLEWHDERRTR